MESEQSGTSTGDGGGGVMLRKPTPSRPQITLPPRNPLDSLVRSSDMTPSPVALASFLAEHDPDDSVSFSSLLAGAISSPGTQGSGEKSDENEAVSGENHVRNSSPSGSFAERLAARTTSGKASGLPGSPSTGRPSTARFKSMPPSRLPIPSKNCVTIPPGLSPTTLLDSPVLLSTSQQAEPSPTTGTFPLPSFLSRSRGPTGSEPAKEKSSELGNSSSFVFKPFPKPGARSTISPLAGLAPFGLSHQQALAQVQAQAQGQGSSGVPASTIPAAPVAVMSRPTPSSGAMINGSALEGQPFQFRLPPKEEKTSEPIAPEQDKQPLVAPVPATVERPNTLDRPSDDGYNWRKYGQKLVKGSENPRSYYKCTYANCPMKKKVERSMDGQVTEIVYEGDHNHPKPQPTRRMSVSAGHVSSDGNSRDFRGGMGRPGTSNGSNRATGGDSDLAVYRGNSLVGNGNQEQSSSSVSDDDDKDDDDPEAKRRKKEKLLRDCPPVPRTVREPRVVVQTTSDVDVLDDGYRWRKYGQKVVKGNPHPRSYYKCTNLGCPVRKHVERASNDPKAVITTYEGKHNHDVPAARNSSHDRVNMDAMAAPPVLANEAGVPSTSSSSTNHDHGSRTQFTDAVTGRELPKENMLSETKVKIEQQMTKSSVSDGMTFLNSVGMSSMTGATMKDPVRPKEEHMSIMNDSLSLPSAFQGAASGLVLGP